MKVNGIFKRKDWKPISVRQYEKFLAIEEILKKNLKGYSLPKEQYPIIEVK